MRTVPTGGGVDPLKSRPSVRLIHWNREEGGKRAEALRAVGCEVAFGEVTGPDLLRRLREAPPSAVVIDLSRIPSQGREVGVALRHAKSTRHLPLVFVGGEPEKVSRIRALLPDAVFAEWSRIKTALRSALLNPPAAPVAPKSVFEAYRGTPLVKKLGIKAHSLTGLAHAPESFRGLLGQLPEGARLSEKPCKGCDLLIWFVAAERELRRSLPRMASLAEGRPLWIAWPKRSSGAQTDLDQQRVRKLGLAAGLVDYKICAIDGTWAGLLFIRRA